jgi:hypothetical protein
MPEIIKIVFGALGMLAIYGSGLLFWPIHWLLRRERTEGERVLFWLFMVQLTLYFGWAVWAFHVGDWLEGLIIVFPMNFLFTIVGFGAFLAAGCKDSAEEKNVS